MIFLCSIQLANCVELGLPMLILLVICQVIYPLQNVKLIIWNPPGMKIINPDVCHSIRRISIPAPVLYLRGLAYFSAVVLFGLSLLSSPLLVLTTMWGIELNRVAVQTDHILYHLLHGIDSGLFIYVGLVEFIILWEKEDLKYPANWKSFACILF